MSLIVLYGGLIVLYGIMFTCAFIGFVIAVWIASFYPGSVLRYMDWVCPRGLSLAMANLKSQGAHRG
jgi:hypothetical protein